MVSWYVPRGTLTSSALPSASDSVKLVITVSLAYLMYTDAKPTGLRLSESRTFRSMLNELPLSIDSSITIWEKAPTAGISSKTRSNISFFIFIFVVLSWKIIMQLFVLCAANITIIFSYATNYISYIFPSLMFISRTRHLLPDEARTGARWQHQRIAPRFDFNCSTLLAPTITEVTSGRRRIHFSAYWARVYPSFRASSFNPSILFWSSGVSTSGLSE